MFKVSYALDVKRLYEALFAAEYEKCNIWPHGDKDDGVEILWEELREAGEAVCGMMDHARDCKIDHGFVPEEKELRDLEAHAVTTICELLQVISVIRKYNVVFYDDLEVER